MVKLNPPFDTSSRPKNEDQGKLVSRGLTKPMFKMVGFLILLFGAIFGYKFIRILMIPPYVPSPASVSAMIVRKEEWQSHLQAIGTLRAIQGVDITTEVAGLVKEIQLKPGAEVNAGDILVQLNADAEIAQRDSLRATLDLAEITLKRDQSQFAIAAISQATIDSDKADVKNKKAQLAHQEAIVVKKTICAPFKGMLGISAVNLGQYLNPGDKIITLQALNPLYIDFSVPQQALASLKIGQKVILKVDTYPDQTFQGVITTLDPKVDPATRNIQVEATIDNPDIKLYPGMFGQVEIYTGVAQKYLTLPKTSISFNPFGEIAYIIHETSKDKMGKSVLTVKQTFVTVGKSRGDQISILEGLKEGDLVVTAGQLKLRNGSTVVVNNSVVPEINSAPSLIDE